MRTQAALSERLVEIGRRGYATSDEELLVGVRSVAVPILGELGASVASISLARRTSSSGSIDDLVRDFVPRLEAVAERISTALVTVHSSRRLLVPGIDDVPGGHSCSYLSVGQAGNDLPPITRLLTGVVRIPRWKRMTTSALPPTVVLRRGAVMPRLGLGTASLDDAATERAVAIAIETGYRLIDTAENYANEVGVGRGLKASGVARADVFVTTKFNKRWHGVELAQQAFEASAARLGVDYIDLLLIHWPNPDQDRYGDAWRGLLGLFEQGRVRAIGTSNFKPAHLDRLLAETGQLPDVNQIQVNPDVARSVPRAYHDNKGIVTMAWSPLGGSRTELFTRPAVMEMAERHGRSPAQIVLRWHIELGLVPVPRSSNRERLVQNLDIFDFALTAEEIQALSALDRGESAAADSDTQGH